MLPKPRSSPQPLRRRMHGTSQTHSWTREETFTVPDMVSSKGLPSQATYLIYFLEGAAGPFSNDESTLCEASYSDSEQKVIRTVTEDHYFVSGLRCQRQKYGNETRRNGYSTSILRDPLLPSVAESDHPCSECSDHSPNFQFSRLGFGWSTLCGFGLRDWGKE